MCAQPAAGCKCLTSSWLWPFVLKVETMLCKSAWHLPSPSVSSVPEGLKASPESAGAGSCYALILCLAMFCFPRAVARPLSKAGPLFPVS